MTFVSSESKMVDEGLVTMSVETIVLGVRQGSSEGLSGVLRIC